MTADAKRNRMLADRSLRDSARALVEADIEFLKGDLARKGLGERAVSRLKSGAIEVYDEAVDVAVDHKGALAALVAAIVVWFARSPLLAVFGAEADVEDDDAQA